MALAALCVLTFDWLPLSLFTPIRTDLGLSVPDMGRALGWFGSCTLLGALFGFFTRKRIDPVLMLKIVLGLLGLDYALTAFSENGAEFILARMAGGMLFGIFWTVATALAFMAPDKTRLLAYLYGGNAVTMALILPLCVWLQNFLNWRALFVVGGGVSLVTVLMLGIGRDSNHVRVTSYGSFGGRSGLGELMRGFGVLGFMFAGCACVYPYFRPLLENNTHLTPDSYSWAFAFEGLAGVLSVWLLKRYLASHSRDESRLIFVHTALLAVISAILGVACLKHATLSVAIVVLMGLWGWGLNGLAFLWPVWLTRFERFDPFLLVALKIGFVQGVIMLGSRIGAWGIGRSWGVNFALGAVLLCASLALSQFRKNSSEYEKGG